VLLKYKKSMLLSPAEQYIHNTLHENDSAKLLQMNFKGMIIYNQVSRKTNCLCNNVSVLLHKLIWNRQNFLL